MTDKESKTTDMAQIVSKVLHPYVVLVPVVALVAYQVSSVPEAWGKWTVTALLPAYLFPLLYMQARVTIVARTTGTRVTYRSLFREQSGEMFLLVCLFGIPSVLILYSLGAPPSIMATLVGLSATGLLITVVNLRYRASFHLALFTSMVIPLVVISGLPSLVIAPFILLLGLSRYHLGEHTPAQLVAGFFVGLLVSGVVLYGFGFLG